MKRMREWATPITVGAFILSAVTGLLMFFHLDSGLNKVAHEWLSWALVLGVAFHLASNFQAFKRHLAFAKARWLMGVFVAVLCLSFVVGDAEDGDRGRQPPFSSAMNALAEAPISALAPLTGSTVEEIIESLVAAGYSVSSPDTRIADLAGGDRGMPFRLIEIVFGSGATSGHERISNTRFGERR